MISFYIWVLFGLFIFAIAYMSLNEAYVVINDYASTEITTSTSLEILNITEVIWVYWPLVILVGGYLMYVLTRSQKPEGF